MFTIDLLKGKELPQKMDLKKSVFKAVPIVIPLLAVTVFAAAYQRDKGMLQTHEHTLRQQQQQIGQYTKDIDEYNKVNRQIKGMQQCLNDIGKALSYRVQVSDVLIEIVQLLPETIFVYEIRMDRSSVQQKIQNESTGNVTQKLVVRRKLKLTLCGYDASQSDSAVQKYVNTLEQSPVLSEVFTEIKASARQQGQVEDKNAIYYEIECVLREQG